MNIIIDMCTFCKICMFNIFKGFFFVNTLQATKWAYFKFGDKWISIFASGTTSHRWLWPNGNSLWKHKEEGKGVAFKHWKT